ncbi:FdrA family protein [Nonomuraea sp. NPDC050328]|uniref:FdrA family protein n=1 Tax=Nonomuraea sp. NPDC050328 TaxID=3364361 RepID=UPI003797C61E
MSARDVVALRPGVYHDSVSLMRVSKALSGLDGVEVAIVAMATGLNLDLARDLGFDVPEPDPSALLVALRAAEPPAALAELDRLLAALAAPASPGDAAERPPRTTRAAALRAPAGLALVSVPGEHAFAEALDALEAGLHVMIFSDGMPLEREVLLKTLADRRGLLVMGPDCGTAVVAGAGLGFANVLKPGPVGLVAASGTGAQQVTCLLDLAGVGVSHVLGVGGRDLSAEVGGRASIRALRLLDDDPATELIVVVAKPGSPETAAAVRAVAEGLRTPVVFGGVDLTGAAEQALRALGRPVPEWPVWPPAPVSETGRTGSGSKTGRAGSEAGRTGTGAGRTGTGAGRAGSGARLVGLFAGGTLCEEARRVAGFGEFTDFGDDEYTRGRAHPMIDHTLRLDALAGVGAGDVVLMDVVLGHGADADPAAALAPAVAACPARVVVSLVGSEGDPQDLNRQAAALAAAGARVFGSNAQAAAHAAALVTGSATGSVTGLVSGRTGPGGSGAEGSGTEGSGTEGSGAGGNGAGRVTG